ncbi:MAG: protein kinase [Prevotellaceae bacterium]|jgi:serine/threonine protein kinase|nr:protein kinase [Prevotellaceae bacterium]
MENNTTNSFRELAAGTTLGGGKYTIERMIGAGGFGITYYARQSGLNRIVAVKEFFINGYCIRNTQAHTVLLQGINENVYEKYKKKFIEEAQTLAALKHPNIVQVIDVFEENNTSYMVMPFIEGQTLQKLVETRGTLDYEQTINYLSQIAGAVGYVHSKNILHRDIKPDNIIITPDYHAILIDFGSAREFVHDKTQQHTSILTQGYAPLEQYSTTSRKGAYSDIYSLGAVYYFALTGQKPLPATDRTMETLPAPKTFVATIPDDVNRTIMKAMELKPENRHQTVDEFMNDLLKNKKWNTTHATDKSRKSKFLLIALIIIFVSAVVIFITLVRSSESSINYGYEQIESAASAIEEVKDSIFDINGEIFKYTGTLKDGIPHGLLGRAVFDDKDQYERNSYNGEWENGKRSGQGTLRYKNRNRYEGDFVDNTFNGCGVLTYASGANYKGQFANGKRNGLGIYKYSSGEIERGEWKDNEFVKKMDESEFNTKFDSVCILKNEKLTKTY